MKEISWGGDVLNIKRQKYQGGEVIKIKRQKYQGGYVLKLNERNIREDTF